MGDSPLVMARDHGSVQTRERSTILNLGGVSISSHLKHLTHATCSIPHVIGFFKLQTMEFYDEGIQCLAIACFSVSGGWA